MGLREEYIVLYGVVRCRAATLEVRVSRGCRPGFLPGRSRHRVQGSIRLILSFPASRVDVDPLRRQLQPPLTFPRPSVCA